MANGRCYVRVVNWTTYQHYRDRNPPWIKMHNTLLEDPVMAALPDATKAHVFGIWLLASRLENKIPADADFIGRRINATSPVDLNSLLKCSFLEWACECLQHASNLLAKCSTKNGGLYTEREQSRAEGEEIVAASAAPPPAAKPKREPSEFPSKRAANVFLKFHPDGEPPGVMFKTLRPLVDKHTWDVVEPELEAFLSQTVTVKFRSWPKFAEGFGTWANGNGTAIVRAGPQTRPPTTAAEKTAAAVERFIQRGGGG